MTKPAHEIEPEKVLGDRFVGLAIGDQAKRVVAAMAVPKEAERRAGVVPAA
jgi:hypothetical protein